MTNDLISRLSSGLRPTPRLTVVRRLLLGVGAGAGVSAALTGATLGFRPDMAEAAGGAAFWLKLGYTLVIAAAALWICERLSRPAGRVGERWCGLAAPVVVMAALATLALARAAPAERMPMLMGSSALVCPWCIAALSLPPLAGAVLAMRSLAPTRLRLAGTVAGLAAGAAGASAYALHCPEGAMPFLAVWYTLGVGLAGAAGGLLGPRVLRW